MGGGCPDVLKIGDEPFDRLSHNGLDFFEGFLGGRAMGAQRGKRYAPGNMASILCAGRDDDGPGHRLSTNCCAISETQ